jgi:hypothetical protein
VPDSEGPRLRLELHQDQYTVVVYLLKYRDLPDSDRETVKLRVTQQRSGTVSLSLH